MATLAFRAGSALPRLIVPVRREAKVMVSFPDVALVMQ